MDIESITVDINRDECPICFETITDENSTITDCNHTYCLNCMNQLIENNIINCSMCRSEIKTYKNKNDNFKIIKIITNNVNLRNERDLLPIIQKLRRNLICQKIVNGILFLYLLDMYYYRLFVGNYYNEYTNCTQSLIEQMNENEKIINKYQMTGFLNIMVDNTLKVCSFPMYFIDQCIRYL